ncbi:MAG TPA: DUF308 domain-containing protein [Candidatus Saccharimonadales bacterium]|nr:DUF308 domain-containing protein [Candidatus Saccharimonadales bacterium]
MKRVFIESILGVLFIFLGIFLIYTYFAGVETTSNQWLLLASGFCTVIGGYCLYLGGKSDLTVNLKKDTNLPKEHSNSQGFGNVLKKNNDLLNQWNKTIAKRDKMKMLEISGAAEESR